MAEIGIAWLALAVWRALRSTSKSGVDKWERARARSIAAMSAGRHRPMPVLDAEWTVLAEQDAQVWRTDEQQQIRPRRRLSARPSSHRRKPKHVLVKRVVRDPLTAPLSGPLAPAVVVASVPVKVQPWQIDGFTEGWQRGDVDALVARGKAGQR